MWPRSYAELLRRAQQRLSSIDHAGVESPFGTIEDAERGKGHSVLVLHGIFGGFDAAYLTIDPWIGVRRAARCAWDRASRGGRVLRRDRLGDAVRAPTPRSDHGARGHVGPLSTEAPQAAGAPVAPALQRPGLLDAEDLRPQAVRTRGRHPERIPRVIRRAAGAGAGHGRPVPDQAAHAGSDLRHPGVGTRCRQLPAGTDERAHAHDPRRGRRARALCDRATGGRPDPGGAAGDDRARRPPVPGAEARVRREVAGFIRAHTPREARPGR